MTKEKTVYKALRIDENLDCDMKDAIAILSITSDNYISISNFIRMAIEEKVEKTLGGLNKFSSTTTLGTTTREAIQQFRKHSIDE